MADRFKSHNILHVEEDKAQEGVVEKVLGLDATRVQLVGDVELLLCVVVVNQHLQKLLVAEFQKLNYLKYFITVVLDEVN